MSENNETALVKNEETQKPISFADAMRPRNYEQAYNLCVSLGKSSICPQNMRNDPMAIMVAIQAGERHGFSILGSIQNIAVINGKPAMYGDALIGVCEASGLLEEKEEKIEGSMEAKNIVATCTVWRKGRKLPVVHSFTYGDAMQAKLIGKAGPWTNYPKRMFQMRARGFALRDAFSDVLSGLITVEEAEDMAIDVQTQQRTRKPTGPMVEARMENKTAAPAQSQEMTDGKCQEIMNQMSMANTKEQLEEIGEVIKGYSTSPNKDALKAQYVEELTRIWKEGQAAEQQPQVDDMGYEK